MKGIYETTYDYIVVGGGLSGCVLASRLRQYLPDVNILVIEAGPDTRAREDILTMQALNVGGNLDWQYKTEPSCGISNRRVVYNQGKGLGGGTAINSGGWTRGNAAEYDEWAALVDDERWNYGNQLPWMKKTEHWFNGENPDQHGLDGPLYVTSSRSTGRHYPLTEQLAAAWDETSTPVLSALDQNAGNNIGRAILCEARRDGLRQTSVNVYPLNGITVITDTLVKKIVLSHDSRDRVPTATGVELADGSVVKSAQVIISAGTIRSPQLLMLSGIGPSAHLQEMGIKVSVDRPEVGQGLTDHMSFFQHWRLRDVEPGLTLGSNNTLLQGPEFGLGVPVDWVVCSDVPKVGLAKAIESDEGVKPDSSHHPLLKRPRAFTETFLLYANLPLPGGPEGSDYLTTDIVSFLPTSRGSVKLQSSDVEDAPQIDMNYLATEVDKYVYRAGLRHLARVMLGTQFGKDYISGEAVTDVESVTLDDSDETLNARLSKGGTTTWHATGTCSMGRVVDSEFRVMGVVGLRVVDASVIPVPLSAHIQAPLYAMSEQAAFMIAEVL